MTPRRIALSLALLFTFSLISAQKIKKVEGEYTFRAPENMSPAEARKVALERAMTAAIANKFGTLVSQNSTTVVRNAETESHTDFYSIGGSEVKGEWIRTINEPEYDITYEQGMLVVRVKVKGEAREIESAAIDLDIRVLKNQPDPKYESIEFSHNDDIFLYFKSPENGHLAVFLLDENTTDVSTLLPYETSGESCYLIKRGKPYIFFSDKTCDKSESEDVESYVMMCTENDVEYNTLYVVFSPNRFSSPISGNRYLDVPTIPYKDFNKWLIHNRKHDKNMNVHTFTVRIKK